MISTVKYLVEGVVEDACDKDGLSKRVVDLALLDATEFDEHIEHLRETIYHCEEVLDTFLLIDEPTFINNVRKILEKNGVVGQELIITDILDEMVMNNETSRRTLS